MMHGLIGRYLLKSLIFLGALAGSTFFLPFFNLFMTNPQFNASILFVWSLTVFLILWGFVELKREEAIFHNKNPSHSRLLAPLFELRTRTTMANSTMIDHALGRARKSWHYDTLRYLSGSLIFIGLLGTLWGLSLTIVDISEVFGNLPSQGITEGFFDLFKSQMRKSLSSMGVAFSSSLFGIGGSVTLGFLLLQLDQARKAFFQRAEVWAPSLFKMLEAPSLHSAQDPDFLQTILEQWLLGVERLGRINYTNEKRKEDLMTVILSFGEKTHTLSELMRVQNLLINKWAEEQLQTRQSFERLGQKMSEMAFSGDEIIKDRLSKILSLLQQIVRFSQEIPEDTRMELKGSRTPDSKKS